MKRTLYDRWLGWEDTEHRPIVVKGRSYTDCWHVLDEVFDTHAEAVAHADRIARLHEPDYRVVPNEGRMGR